MRREKKSGHNVVAYLPATTPPGSLQKPWIALGAHYDHLGHGENGNSLADKTEAGRIHYGADDNASGSAAVLAAGEALSKETTRRRNVLLEFWSGEEIGLIGSAAYVNAPPVPVDQLAAYFNFDMVGRMQDNKLTVQAAGSSDAWARAIEQANVAAGFDLLVQADPYQPTDVSSFYQAGVPSLNFFTGTHTDYHRPSDTANKINYEDLDRVVAFATAIARRVGNGDQPPAYAKVQQETQGGGARRRPRVHGNDSRLFDRSEGAAAKRGHRRRTRRGGRPPERRRHRRNRRPDDRQHLRLHLRAGSLEDRGAHQGRLYARDRTEGNDPDAGREKVADSAHTDTGRLELRVPTRPADVR